MGRYSEIIGSFIRTSDCPLEANYYFDTELELIEFYEDPINRTTLHKGLLKVVGDLDLYWVCDSDGTLQFKKLLSKDSLDKLALFDGEIGALIENAYYNSETEELIIVCGSTEIKIPVADLITEWEVNNAEDTAVILLKVRSVAGLDKLSADIRISNDPANIIEKDSNGLLVQGLSDKIKYKDKTLSVFLAELSELLKLISDWYEG